MVVDKIKQFFCNTDIPFLAMPIFIVISFLAPPALYAGDGFTIEAAKWDDERNRITVKGKGDDGRTVSVTNADTGLLLGSDDVDDEKWRVRKRNPSSVPCRIRAEQSNGESAEKNVKYAPADCDDGGGTPPPPPPGRRCFH